MDQLNEFLKAAQGGNHRHGRFCAAYDADQTVSYWQLTSRAARLLATQEAGRHLDGCYDDDLRLPDLEALLMNYLQPYAVEWRESSVHTRVVKTERFATRGAAVKRMVQVVNKAGLNDDPHGLNDDVIDAAHIERWGEVVLDSYARPRPSLHLVEVAGDWRDGRRKTQIHDCRGEVVPEAV